MQIIQTLTAHAEYAVNLQTLLHITVFLAAKNITKNYAIKLVVKIMQKINIKQI